MEQVYLAVIQLLAVALAHRLHDHRPAAGIGQHLEHVNVEGPARQLHRATEEIGDCWPADVVAAELTQPLRMPDQTWVEDGLDRRQIAGGKRRIAPTQELFVLCGYV